MLGQEVRSLLIVGRAQCAIEGVKRKRERTFGLVLDVYDSSSPLRGGGWEVGGVQVSRRLRVGTPPLPCPSPARGEGAL